MWRDNAVAVAHALGHFLVSDDVACTIVNLAKQSHQKNVMVIYVLTTKYAQLTYF